MNILLINIYKTVNSRGGVENVLCKLANSLEGEGNDVTIVCYDKDNGVPGYDINDRVKFINLYGESAPLRLRKLLINIRSLSTSKLARDKKRTLLNAQALCYRLGKYIKNAPDLIIAFQCESAIAADLFYKGNVPIITMLHNTPLVYPLLDMFPEILQRTTIQVLREEYIDIVKNKIKNSSIHYIPNAVPQIRDRIKFTEKKIINVGRISPEKQQIFLVEAFKIVHDKYPDWKLELWGDTETEKEYVTKLIDNIDKLKLNEAVTICGITKSVGDKLKESSIFAFPSKYEGFPLALSEAMAYGMGVIGLKTCSGVNTLITDHRTGILTENKVESFSSAIIELIEDERLRNLLGNNARNEMTKFSEENVFSMWKNLIAKVCKNGAQ